MVRVRGVQQHARGGLPALAPVRVVVGADSYFVQRQARAQLAIDLLHSLGGLGPAGDVRLIGNDDQNQAGVVEPPAGALDSWQQLKLLGGCRRVRLSVHDSWAVQNAVTIKEDGRPAGGGVVRRAHSRPERASGTIASIESRSASREPIEFCQPRARMREVSNRTTGTSPFHPRSPPL